MSKARAPLEFDWDKGNRQKNWIKHEVTSKEAEEIFQNKPFKTFPDSKHSQKEIRVVGYGITNRKRKLIVIFTIREEKIRIISTRDMNKKEIKKYETKN